MLSLATSVKLQNGHIDELWRLGSQCVLVFFMNVNQTQIQKNFNS